VTSVDSNHLVGNHIVFTFAEPFFHHPTPKITMHRLNTILCFTALLLSWCHKDKDGILFVVEGFQQHASHVSPSLSIRSPSRRRPYGCYATTQEKQKVNGQGQEEVNINANGETVATTTDASGVINGDVDMETVSDTEISPPPAPLMVGDFNATVQVVQLMDEISRRINEGTTELVQNITNVVDEQMNQLPESAAVELTEYLGDIAQKIQKAQMEEVQRQMEELEKIFVSPLERVAFSDAPLFELDQKKVQQIPKDLEFENENQEERKLILTGANSTLTKSARMRTAELIRNFNVAPMYYSIALLYRWFRKASVSDRVVCVVNR
jgi:hypothetical protein